LKDARRPAQLWPSVERARVIATQIRLHDLATDFKDLDRDEPMDSMPLTQPLESLQRPLSELERYAGWLAKDHVSVAVRADVQALAAAMKLGNDTSLLVLTLQKDIGRLPSGAVRKMLRKAVGEIRTVLGPGEIDAQAGEGS
jgi:hypothetical protein